MTIIGVSRMICICCHMQASATPQNVMNMAEMASRTAQLWLEFAESEPSHPERALPAPDPYNQEFYSFTRKDPDNEVGAIIRSEQTTVSCSLVQYLSNSDLI